MRTSQEQIEGLMSLMDAAGKVHKLNMTLIEAEHDLYEVRLVGHAENVSVVYSGGWLAVGGYDFWIDGSLHESDLNLETAAALLAQRYMDAKLRYVITVTWGMSSEVADRVLADPVERERFFADADKPSQGKSPIWGIPVKKNNKKKRGKN